MEPVYGQPTTKTHPHLLKSGELLPGIQIEEFQERRRKFIDLIITDVLKTYGQPMQTIVIIPSATKLYMTEKIPYLFRQNTDFLYLSGCMEPDTALVFTGSRIDDFICTIFVRKQDDYSLTWDGPRTGVDIAPTLFGVDQAFLMSDLSDFLVKNIEKYPDSLLFYDLQTSSHLPIHSVINRLIQNYRITLCRACSHFLHQLRLIKSPSEQKLMLRAGQITSKAIRKAMEVTQPGLTEHHLFATVDYESRMHGAEILAYPPVVACGKNANIIHYIDNKQMMHEGEMLLMDAGCEYHGYSSDITRTWPVNGKFSKYQLILYELVLEVQLELIEQCAKRSSLDSMYQLMINLLGRHLRNEKILKKEIDSSVELNSITSELCPHHSNHYLGMDIHDVKSVSKSMPLRPGMVITVEPGIYVKENSTIAPEFWNIGIRIEDDILITETDFEILSGDCPKTVQDIENVMRK